MSIFLNIIYEYLYAILFYIPFYISPSTVQEGHSACIFVTHFHPSSLPVPEGAGLHRPEPLSLASSRSVFSCPLCHRTLAVGLVPFLDQSSSMVGLRSTDLSKVFPFSVFFQKPIIIHYSPLVAPIQMGLRLIEMCFTL